MSVMVELDLDMDDAALISAMNRYKSEFGKDEEDVVKFTANKIAVSMGGATKKSSKLRKIVKNPDERAKTDRRRGFIGVMKFKADRSEYFVPIYRGGEFGNIRFPNKNTGEMMVRNRVTGKVTREQFSVKEFEAAGGVGVRNNPKRKIGRSGLAKKSWRGISRRVNSGGTVSAMGVSNAGSVDQTKSFGGFEITLNNRLRYALDAIDQSKYGSILAKATSNMHGTMDARVKAKLKRAGLT